MSHLDQANNKRPSASNVDSELDEEESKISRTTAPPEQKYLECTSVSEDDADKVSEKEDRIFEISAKQVAPPPAAPKEEQVVD